MTEPNNGQYGKDLFGFDGSAFTDTNAPGTSGGDATNSQYANGRVPGDNLDASALSSTGAPGSTPGVLNPDGGSASVTNVFGHLAGNDAPNVTGTTNTNAEHIGADPFTHNGVTDTGIGSGSPTHSDAGGHDQSSPWTAAGE